ncbi:MAG: hypothetical protein WBW32_04210 [Luteibacter sp.]
MTLFRKSLTAELSGRAQRLAGAVTQDRPLEWKGAARQYAGHAGVMAARAGKQVRNHPRASIAVGAGLGVAALAAAWLLRRHQLKQQAYLDRDEHDPTRYRASNDSGDALDGSGEDNPIPGETGLY